ncbi:MAG TPA: hypothetical protein VJK50_02975 [Patescibacteria group bacterium]|nr:hypothetical protein [Patescibacteria group bacterium]
MNKTGYIYIIVSIVVIVAGLLIYGFWFGGWEQLGKLISNSSDQTAKDGSVAGASLDERQGLYAVSTRTVVSPILSLKQNTIWYFDEQGQLYRSKFDGSDEQTFALSSPQPASEVLWPQAGNDFIERLATGSTASFRLYNSESQAFVNLPPAVQRVAWLPDGKRIIYIWRRADSGLELKVAAPDTTDFKKIADVGDVLILRPAPSGDYVLLIPPITSVTHTIVKLDMATLTQTVLISDGRNLDANIASDGKKFIFSRINERSGLAELWLYDFSTSKATPLNIRSSTEKTVWSSNSALFYYAIPDSTPAGDPLYLQKGKDAVFSYDLQKGESEALPYAFDSLRFDARDLLLLDSGKILFFRNGWDGRLYRLNIK